MRCSEIPEARPKTSHAPQVIGSELLETEIFSVVQT